MRRDARKGAKRRLARGGRKERNTVLGMVTQPKRFTSLGEISTEERRCSHLDNVCIFLCGSACSICRIDGESLASIAAVAEEDDNVVAASRQIRRKDEGDLSVLDGELVRQGSCCEARASSELRVSSYLCHYSHKCSL